MIANPDSNSDDLPDASWNHWQALTAHDAIPQSQIGTSAVISGAISNDPGHHDDQTMRDFDISNYKF